MKKVMLGCHSVWCGKPQDSCGLEMYNSVLTQTSEVRSKHLCPIKRCGVGNCRIVVVWKCIIQY
jgi:hypothetical protein